MISYVFSFQALYKVYKLHHNHLFFTYKIVLLRLNLDLCLYVKLLYYMKRLP